MKIRLSELRKMIREELTEMKLGLASAIRGSQTFRGVPAAEPLGSPDGDVIDYERDLDSDEYDELTLDKNNGLPKVVGLKHHLHGDS
jgi:hypothetical protein